MNKKINFAYKNLKSFDWKKHLVDTTVINALGVPICAAMEMSTRLCDLISKLPYLDVSPIPAEVSMRTKAYGVGLGYLGLAFLLSKGRAVSRELFKINENSRESLQWAHDTAYLVGFNALINPALYYFSGSRDLKEIIGGTLALSIFSVFAGGPIGYGIDVFRDLTGLESCKRRSYPNFIRNQSKKIKKGLAALLVTGAVTATIGIYSFIPPKEGHTLLENENPTQILRPYEPPKSKGITSFINS